MQDFNETGFWLPEFKWFTGTDEYITLKKTIETIKKTNKEIE